MQLGSIRPGALKAIPIFQQVHLVAIATICVLENANIFVIISPQRRFPTSIMLVVDVSTKVLLSVTPINPPSQDFALYFFFACKYTNMNLQNLLTSEDPSNLQAI